MSLINIDSSATSSMASKSSTRQVSNLEFEVWIHKLYASVGKLCGIAIRVDAHAMVTPAPLDRVSQDVEELRQE